MELMFSIVGAILFVELGLPLIVVGLSVFFGLLKALNGDRK
jgi:hypothetical protein